jgi:hypothetical protein
VHGLGVGTEVDNSGREERGNDRVQREQALHNTQQTAEIRGQGAESREQRERIGLSPAQPFYQPCTPPTFYPRGRLSTPASTPIFFWGAWYYERRAQRAEIVFEFSFWVRENGTNFLIKSQENYCPWYVARRSRRLSMRASQCSKNCRECVCHVIVSPRRAGTSLQIWTALSSVYY